MGRQKLLARLSGCHTQPLRLVIEHLGQSGAIVVIDVLEREEMPFPHLLPEFQRLFPDEAAVRAKVDPVVKTVMS